jgi:hypothetical protein
MSTCGTLGHSCHICKANNWMKLLKDPSQGDKLKKFAPKIVGMLETLSSLLPIPIYPHPRDTMDKWIGLGEDYGLINFVERCELSLFLHKRV